MFVCINANLRMNQTLCAAPGFIDCDGDDRHHSRFDGVLDVCLLTCEDESRNSLQLSFVRHVATLCPPSLSINSSSLLIAAYYTSWPRRCPGCCTQTRTAPSAQLASSAARLLRHSSSHRHGCRLAALHLPRQVPVARLQRPVLGLETAAHLNEVMMSSVHHRHRGSNRPISKIICTSHGHPRSAIPSGSCPATRCPII